MNHSASQAASLDQFINNTITKPEEIKGGEGSIVVEDLTSM